MKTEITAETRNSASLQDPLAFARDMLGLEAWHLFDDLFSLLAQGERRILVRSANGVGKTTALAVLCLWKLSHSDECIVLTTSSSHEQLRRNLWGEIRRLARRSGHIDPKAIKTQSILLGEKRYAIGISPSDAENAQGYHAASMLIAIDEATGIERDIMHALLGTATGTDTQIVMIYNPVAIDSFVFEAERSGVWKIVTISALDHPNVVTGANLAPGAVTRDSFEERLAVWSFPVNEEDGGFAFAGNHWMRSPETQKRLLGEWVEDSGDGQIPLAVIRRSLTIAEKRGTKCIGIDVGRSDRDATVFALFDGNVQLPFHIMYSRDLTRIADKAAEFFAEGFEIIAIDDTGVGGGLTDILKRQGIDVLPVNFAQAAKGFLRTAYRELTNARTEMYFNIDDELKRGVIRLVDDDKLHQELATVRLKFSENRSAYSLEPKENIRSRLGRSSDRADATVLARYGLRLAALSKKNLLVV